MKKFFTFAVMFAAVAMVACGGQQTKATEEVAPEAAEATEAPAEAEVAPEAEVAVEATETVAE
jgi:hypothetical protein